MKKFVLIALGVVVLASAATADLLVLDDPLQGSTVGTVGGGQFVSGGWKVLGEADSVYWHIPTISYGAVEFDITGLVPGESRSSIAGGTELWCQYDYTYGDADNTYAPGYRDNPYKCYVRKQGSTTSNPDGLRLVWQIGGSGNFSEIYTPALTWSQSATYLFRLEWGPDGSGASYFRTYRDGVLIETQSIPGSWNPTGHSVRIGASAQGGGSNVRGAPIDAIYSNVKVWDYTPPAPPSAPQVFWPVNGATVRTTTPIAAWIGDDHNAYQARVNSVDDPDAGIVWDSGIVSSTESQAVTGALPDSNDYYVFVRLKNDAGWSDWTSRGHRFRVDTSYVWPRHGLVRVSGYCLEDDGGKFLGLGATYMQALSRCKYDRERYRRDMAYLASQGVGHIRALSMVGYNAVWQGMEIAPVDFYNQNGVFVAAWPDYWQQLRDMIDIAYDEFGIRVELTIFADAQLMPADADRRAHMDGVLASLPGREHKIAYLEVANEYFKNGFPDPGGPSTIREYGQYLTDRTSIPVSLSTPNGKTDSVLIALYSGSTADLATQHFTRDCATIEGGWLPVRDPWRVYGLPGVPPVSNDEPIGPGSSGTSQTDEIKLLSGAAFSWMAKLPCYVFHSDAGTHYNTRFEDKPGLSKYQRLLDILPSDIPNWTRNDGLESAAPFTVFCNGQPNKYWPDVSSPTDGCDRNIGSVKLNQFVCYPMGILGGGVTLQARRPVTFTVYNPLTGAVVMGPVSKNTGDQSVLAQGPGAYIVEGTLDDVDVTPPGPVTNFKAYGGDGSNNLSWTNPTDSDFAGTKILAKTADYPSSATDGTVVYDGTGTSCSHTSLTNGTKYYYAAYAYDEVTNYSAAAQAGAHAAADATIPEAKALANNQVRAIRGSVVTAVFSGNFYIQAPTSGGPYALKVTSTEIPSIGQKVDVVGLMSGQGTERYLDPSGNAVKVTDAGPITIGPAALNNKAVGGANLNAYTPGVAGGTGPNNIGLLVRVFGKVTQRDTSELQYFYVDDGCGLKDGTKTSTVDNVGIRIKTDPTDYPSGSCVVVTGIGSPFSSSGLRRQVLPRTGEIQIIKP